MDPAPIAIMTRTFANGEVNPSAGIIGAIILPTFLKCIGVRNPVQMGLSIGTASHAVGTSRALELGEVEGAMSGLAIGISGLITAVILSVCSAVLL